MKYVSIVVLSMVCVGCNTLESTYRVARKGYNAASKAGAKTIEVAEKAYRANGEALTEDEKLKLMRWKAAAVNLDQSAKDFDKATQEGYPVLKKLLTPK